MLTPLRGATRRSNPLFLGAAKWIASRSLSSGARSRDPLARNDDFKALASWLFEILNNEVATLSSPAFAQGRLGLVSHHCEDRRRRVNLTVTSFVYALQTISRAPARA
jgi:hypothetical protein